MTIDGVLREKMEMELKRHVVATLVDDLASSRCEDDLKVVARVDDLAPGFGSVSEVNRGSSGQGRKGHLGVDVYR